MLMQMRRSAKRNLEEVLGTLGILESGENTILDIRRALTPIGKQIYAQREKRNAFYRTFIKPGALCFDVGANYGTRIEAFLLAQARVVAVEPQDDVMHYLQLKYGRDSRVTLIHAGLGETQGEAEMFICDTTSGASSMSRDLINIYAKKHPNLQYTRVVKVQITTLDNLISQYGMPDFCKIDVEGFEYKVLTGLSRPIPKLSFEYQPERLQPALDCINKLEQLGKYQYNYSVEESMTFAQENWIDADSMLNFVRNEIQAKGASFGDIYANLA